MSVPLVAEERTESPHQGGPGPRLQHAREQRGWSIEQVAQRLHLDNAAVLKLESNDYARLPSPVFVRGYLINYARLLEIPVDPLLQSYRQAFPATEVNPNLRAASGKTQVNSSQPLVRILTLLIIVVMVVLVLLWWQGFLEQNERRADPPPAAGSGLLQPAQPLNPPPPPMGQLAPPLSQQPVANPIIEAEVPPRNSVVTATGSSTPQQREGRTPAVAPADAGAGATAAAPAGAEQGAAASSAPSEAREAVASEAGIPPFTLEFRFVDASWTDVRDSSGKLLIIGEQRGGSQRTLSEGTPPFSVVLGRASSVRVAINGEPFDLAPHSNRNVARFTLTKERLGME